MEWNWETQKKIWEKRVGKEHMVQPNGTSWHKLEYVELVEQGEAGLQIYVEQVEQKQGGLQIDVEQVEQGQGKKLTSASTQESESMNLISKASFLKRDREKDFLSNVLIRG